MAIEIQAIAGEQGGNFEIVLDSGMAFDFLMADEMKARRGAIHQVLSHVIEHPRSDETAGNDLFQTAFIKGFGTGLREEFAAADLRNFQFQLIHLARGVTAGGPGEAFHGLRAGVGGDIGQRLFGFGFHAGQHEDFRRDGIRHADERKQEYNGNGALEPHAGQDIMQLVQALILGCGFTGERVRRLLRDKGIEALYTSRTGEGLRLNTEDADSLANVAGKITPETVVLHSIPVAVAAPLFRMSAPARVVYLSTTGVYGTALEVDEHSEPQPRTARELARFAEERDVAEGPWSSLILRPAAIYGPGRGIHASMREGKYRLFGDGSNYVSRIHVDDLAAHAAAAMLSDVTGAYPVADEEPCTSHEIAEYCASLLGIPLPEPAADDALGETRRADRRVNGSAIRGVLGLRLKYPNYRVGIAASLVEEARALSTS